tara:strand:- start:1704 stop:1910 length:207 start_codon:yes stop_codon:yes gene_type:complete
MKKPYDGVSFIKKYMQRDYSIVTIYSTLLSSYAGRIGKYTENNVEITDRMVAILNKRLDQLTKKTYTK